MIIMILMSQFLQDPIVQEIATDKDEWIETEFELNFTSDEIPFLFDYLTLNELDPQPFQMGEYVGTDVQVVMAHYNSTNLTSDEDLVLSFNAPIVFYDDDQDGIEDSIYECSLAAEIPEVVLNLTGSHDWVGLAESEDCIRLQFRITPNESRLSITSIEHQRCGPYPGCDTVTIPGREVINLTSPYFTDDYVPSWIPQSDLYGTPPILISGMIEIDQTPCEGNYSFTFLMRGIGFADPVPYFSMKGVSTSYDGTVIMTQSVDCRSNQVSFNSVAYHGGSPGNA